MHCISIHFFHHFMNHIMPTHDRALYSKVVRCWQWTTLPPDPDAIIQCFFVIHGIFLSPLFKSPERAVKSAVIVVLVSYQHGWPWDMVWNWISLIAQQPISIPSVWRHVRFIENKQGPVLVWSPRHHPF